MEGYIKIEYAIANEVLLDIQFRRQLARETSLQPEKFDQEFREQELHKQERNID